MKAERPSHVPCGGQPAPGGGFCGIRWQSLQWAPGPWVCPRVSGENLVRRLLKSEARGGFWGGGARVCISLGFGLHGALTRQNSANVTLNIRALWGLYVYFIPKENRL